MLVKSSRCLLFLLPVLILGLAAWRVKLVADSWRPALYEVAGNARELVFSADGSQIVATYDATIEIIDLGTQRRFRFPSLASGWTFSAGKREIMGWRNRESDERQIKLEFRSFPSGVLVNRRQFDLPERACSAPSLTGNEVRIVSAERLYHWPIQRRTSFAPDSPISLHTPGRVLISAAFAADGSTVALLYENLERYSNQGGWIRLLDARSGRTLTSISLSSVDYGQEIQFSRGGHFVTISDPSLIHVIDLSTGRGVWNTAAEQVDFTPDDRLALTVPIEGKSLEVRNSQSGQLVRKTLPLGQDIDGLVTLGPECRWAYLTSGRQLYRVRIQ